MLKVGENKMAWNKLSNLFGSVKIAFETSRFIHSFKGVIFGWQFDSTRSLRPAQATITRTVTEVAPMSESKFAEKSQYRGMTPVTSGLTCQRNAAWSCSQQPLLLGSRNLTSLGISVLYHVAVDRLKSQLSHWQRLRTLDSAWIESLNTKNP